jgi:mono/diheme cytochrome c family protein
MEHMMISSWAKERPARSLSRPSTELGMIVLFFALSCTAVLVAQPPAAGASAKQGNEIFHKRCITCHNKEPEDTSPFGPPNLYKVFRGHPKITNAQAETIIMNGRGQMPSFKAILTRSEIRSVLAYLRSR